MVLPSPPADTAQTATRSKSSKKNKKKKEKAKEKEKERENKEKPTDEDAEVHDEESTSAIRPDLFDARIAPTEWARFALRHVPINHRLCSHLPPPDPRGRLNRVVGELVLATRGPGVAAAKENAQRLSKSLRACGLKPDNIVRKRLDKFLHG
jgi:hypothetical protein